MGHYVDGVKFAGGSFSLFPEDKLRELIKLTHENDAYVSTVCYSNRGHGSPAWVGMLTLFSLGWMDGAYTDTV
jgi:hypothetical protein